MFFFSYNYVFYGSQVSNPLVNSTKLTVQDALDVQKNSSKAENRLIANFKDFDLTDKENKLPQVNSNKILFFKIYCNSTIFQ